MKPEVGVLADISLSAWYLDEIATSERRLEGFTIV